MGPIGATLTIVSLAFCSSGWLGKHRLERWQSVLDRQLHGRQSIFSRLDYWFSLWTGMLSRKNLARLRDFFSMLPVLGISAMFVLFLVFFTQGKARDQLLGIFSFLVCTFLIVALIAPLGFVFLVISVCLTLFATRVLLWLLLIPYQITKTIEAEHRMERTFQLLGVLTGVLGVLSPI
jgi:hypothetical protein